MANKRTIIFAVLSITVLAMLSSLVVSGCRPARPTSTAQNAAAVNALRFTPGANYPWHWYGVDFGISPWGHLGVSTPDARKEVEEDFADLNAHGVKVVRWFVFGDGRSGIQFNKHGYVTGIDGKVLPDMEAAVEIARRYDIKIVFVLTDFTMFSDDTRTAGRPWGSSALINDPAKRRSLIEKAFRPVVKHFADEKQILAWEVVNEPEWVMSIGRLPHPSRGEIATADMLKFVKDTTTMMHGNSTQMVTLGSASRWWVTIWADCGLDFLQFHYYPVVETKAVMRMPKSLLMVDVPVIVGEFPSANTKYSLTQHLDAFADAGYDGAWVWSYRASDRYTNFKSHIKEYKRWVDKNRSIVKP